MVSERARRYDGAKPDHVDLRDEIYAPSLGLLPPVLLPDKRLRDAAQPGRLVVGTRDQGSGPTCVGQALAAVIDIQRRLQGVGEGERVSGRMLYAMARYHELEGTDARGGAVDGVRRLRSGIKAFYHHGACAGDGEGAWAEGDERRAWPSEAQARSAEQRALGAYYRLRPILNHYHSALRESRAVLVSAEIHEGWNKLSDGVIDLAESDGPSLGTHAFVLVGYDERGFLVLNSWGEGWGGYKIEGAPAKGIALWTYADWARSVRDGWVLRLGVPGRDAFAAGAGERGLPADLFDPKRRRRSTPFHELRGHFLNLEDGRCVESGPYATPHAGFDDLVVSLADAVRGSEGVVLRLPGILEPLDEAFTRAVRQKEAAERHGLFYFTVFWCAEFATEVNRILADIFQRCSARGGENGEELDALFEAQARGAGRAFWRDIERHARSAVLECDPKLRDGLDDACDTGEGRRGRFGAMFDSILAACRDAGKPLHVVTDGAGALVLDALVVKNCIEAEGNFRAGCLPGLSSLVMALPALPTRRAEKTVLPLARQLLLRDDGAARIIVPSEELEKRLSVHGYGGSILRLVARSFLDPIRSDASAALVEPMLGQAPPPGSVAETDASLFEELKITPRLGLDQAALARHLQLEAQVFACVHANQTRLATPPGPAAAPTEPVPGPAEPPASASPSPERSTMSKIDPTDLQRRIADGSLTPEEAERYLIVDTEASAPFTPVIRVNPETVAMPEDGARSALALNGINWAARLARKAQFYRKLSEGYTGPRIAAEGDSWFQYPIMLQDVIDRVGSEFAVFCTSAAGDLLEDMARERDYIQALKESGAEILLLSAGGNDLCAGGALAGHLERFHPDLKPGDYLKRSYQDLLDSAIAWYERICRDVRGAFPNVTIVCHGYDYAIPNAGRWLGRPMREQGITDPALQRAIGAEMVDRFNRTLRHMAETLPHVVYVDCRGAVPASGWHDELHPKNPGFAAVADRIAAKIRELTGARSAPAAFPAPDRVGPEAKAWALHVGLNEVDPRQYAGWRGTLRGCENDARAMKALTEAEGFTARLMLTPEATREAVVAEIDRAAGTLREGDHFVFSISSHGSQVPDFNGDERLVGGVRQPDSTLCLYDAQLIDDEIFDIWTRFAPGVRVLMIADCCHSGSVAKATMPSFVGATSPSQLVALSMAPEVELWPRNMPGDVAAEVIAATEDDLRARSGQFRHMNEQLLASPLLTPLKASVLQIGACQDEQVAYDGPAHGVFTAALLRVWDRGAFRDDHYAFHKRIVETAGARQLPNLFEPHPIDHAFGRQRPFTVWGGAGRPQTPPVKRTEASDRAWIEDFVQGEGEENDVPEPLPEGVRSVPRAPVDPGVLARFAEFLRPENLVFFDPEEFLFLGNSHYAPGGRASGLNAPPPEDLWPNIRKTAKLIDDLRARLGVPVRILSGYRNEAYNRAIGGERNSMHMKFLACDIAADGVPPGRVADMLSRMRDEGRFAGGIGRYRGFTHVDTRGTNATWGSNGGTRSAVERPAERPEEVALRELASRDFRLPGALPRTRGGGTRAGLASADAAVNGGGLVTFAPVMDEDMRRAVLYSTQFAQRAADARVDAVSDRVAWWGVYNAALGAVGWVTRGADFRRAQTSSQTASIDRLALDAIAGFVGAGKLAAIQSVLDALRGAGEGDERLALLDLFGSEGSGGLFQLGAAEATAAGEVTLALGAVHFRNVDRRKRIVFFNWGDQSTDFWVAAAQMTLNLDFYRDVARRIVEEKLADAESLIAAFAVNEVVQ